jgi:hypothetical protein
VILPPPGARLTHLPPRYGYNYAWNSEVATRAFWEDSEKGFGKVPRWWENCNAPYSRSWWGRFRSEPCGLGGEVMGEPGPKFLGEQCKDHAQCENDVVKSYADLKCGPTLTCVFDEDSERMNGGTDWTMDAFALFKSEGCSNCRNAENACAAYGGADPFETDTSTVAAGSGLLVLSGALVLGIGLKAGRRQRTTTEDQKRINADRGVAMQQQKGVV